MSIIISLCTNVPVCAHHCAPQLSQKLVPPPTVGEDSGGGEKGDFLMDRMIKMIQQVSSNFDVTLYLAGFILKLHAFEYYNA